MSGKYLIVSITENGRTQLKRVRVLDEKDEISVTLTPTDGSSTGEPSSMIIGGKEAKIVKVMPADTPRSTKRRGGAKSANRHVNGEDDQEAEDDEDNEDDSSDGSTPKKRRKKIIKRASSKSSSKHDSRGADKSEKRNPVTKTEGIPDFCRICNHQFDSDIDLCYHIKNDHVLPKLKSHNDIPEPVIDDVASVSASDTSEHRTGADGNSDAGTPSKRRRDAKRSHQCNSCQTRCVSLRTLAAHRKEKHDLDTIDPKTGAKVPYVNRRYQRLKCPKCDKISNDRTTYARHLMAVHTPKDQKPYQCDFDGCDQTFIRVIRLLEHRRNTHWPKDQNFFICQICCHGFKTSRGLKTHMITHSGLRYKCKSCDQDFPSISGRDYHYKKEHLQVKSVECQFCDYRCYTKGNMRIHLGNVHKDQADEKDMYITNRSNHSNTSAPRNTTRTTRNTTPKRSNVSKVATAADPKPILVEGVASKPSKYRAVGNRRVRKNAREVERAVRNIQDNHDDQDDQNDADDASSDSGVRYVLNDDNDGQQNIQMTIDYDQYHQTVGDSHSGYVYQTFVQTTPGTSVSNEPQYILQVQPASTAVMTRSQVAASGSSVQMCTLCDDPYPDMRSHLMTFHRIKESHLPFYNVH